MGELVRPQDVCFPAGYVLVPDCYNFVSMNFLPTLAAIDGERLGTNRAYALCRSSNLCFD